jgi:hypothetical protein
MVDTNSTPFARNVQKQKAYSISLLLQTATLPVDGVALTVSDLRMRKNKNCEI